MKIEKNSAGIIVLTNKNGKSLKTPFQSIIPFSEHYYIGQINNYPLNYKYCSNFFILNEDLEVLKFPKIVSVLPNNFIVTEETIIIDKGRESRDGVSLEKKCQCNFIYNSNLEKLFAINTYFLIDYKYLYWNKFVLIYYKDELSFGGIDFLSGKQYESAYSFKEIQTKLNIDINLDKESEDFYSNTEMLWIQEDTKNSFLTSKVIFKDILKFEKLKPI